ncbi:MAG: flagellar export protein FliJ [Desulfobacterales bacterium]|nr:flagellar export protein FliJ [Desulfobacterales bacterium]
MKKFEFKLESLLNYRRHRELIARQDVSQAVMDLMACEARIQDLEQQRDHGVGVLEEKISQGLNATLFNQYSDYLNGLAYLIQREKDQHRHYENILEEKRKILKKRSIDKKAMERLRDKRKQEYTKAILAEEQKELDEISSLKTARELSNAME